MILNSRMAKTYSVCKGIPEKQCIFPCKVVLTKSGKKYCRSAYTRKKRKPKTKRVSRAKKTAKNVNTAVTPSSSEESIPATESSMFSLSSIVGSDTNPPKSKPEDEEVKAEAEVKQAEVEAEVKKEDEEVKAEEPNTGILSSLNPFAASPQPAAAETKGGKRRKSQKRSKKRKVHR